MLSTYRQNEKIQTTQHFKKLGTKRKKKSGKTYEKTFGKVRLEQVNKQPNSMKAT